MSDDASALIKEAQEYQQIGAIYWDSNTRVHMVPLNTPAIKVRLVELPGFLQARREDIIASIIDHLMREVAQPDVSGKHGARSGYDAGCRGLLCRRANREGFRPVHGSKPSVRYAVPDELLDEAESRILPEEVISQVRWADRVKVG
jgi:hypothetical protein